MRNRVAVSLCVWCACAVAVIARPRTVEAQNGTAQNVVLIVTDGLRWQDFFTGADTALISRKMGGVGDTAALRKAYWRADPVQRRRVLFPFLWSDPPRGVVFGSPMVGAMATVTNGKKFSYPGYNEMLTGRPDPRIDKNDYGPNPNKTVFEWLNTLPAYTGRVSAFGTWGVFNDIFNRDRAGILVHAGWEPPRSRETGTNDPTIDRLYRTTTRVWSDVAFDALMQAAVVDHIRSKKPRVLFVGYGETDEWAHSRRYDLVMQSAHNVDAHIAELWDVMQAMPEYRGRTTFIITTDHGRGHGDKWTDHGEDVEGADRIWLAMIGPGAARVGEVPGAPVTQAQIAATVASLLGEDFAKFDPRAAKPLVAPK